jgi:hypothetical protein
MDHGYYVRIQRWDVVQGNIVLSLAVQDSRTHELGFSEVRVSERELVKWARALLRDHDRSKLEQRLQQMLF